MKYAAPEGGGLDSLGVDASPFEIGARWREMQPEPVDASVAPVGAAAHATSLGADMLIAEENNRRAALQGVSPYIDEMRAIAPLSTQDDAGGLYFKGIEGKDELVEPSKHLIFRDPNSGNLTVYERDPKFNEHWIKSLGRFTLPFFVTGPLTGPMRYAMEAMDIAPILKRSPAAERAARIAQGSEALQAFENQGIEAPGFIFGSGPIAAAGRQLMEMPYLGANVRSGYEGAIEGAAIKSGDIAGGIVQATTDVEAGDIVSGAMQRGLEETRNLVSGVAEELSPTASHFDAGRALQAGLQRATTAGLAKVEPGAVEALGIPAEAQVPSRLNMSRGAAATAAEADPIRQALGQPFERRGQTVTSIPAATTRGVSVPSALPRDLTLTTRTSAEMLDDQQLDRLVRAPAAQTSFSARAEALNERAWRMLPPMMKVEDKKGRIAANPNMVAAHNTRRALLEIDRSIANQIAGQGTISGDLARRIRSPQAANFQMNDLRAIRTEVGRAIGRLNSLTPGLDAAQLNQLYAAATKDMEIGFETLANRALIRSRLSNNQSNYVSPAVASRAAGALRAFRTADRYYRAGKVRFERFARILNADHPEAAAKIIVAATKDRGKGNLDLIRTALAVLRPEERNEIASLVLREMGTPSVSSGQLEKTVGFSGEALTKNWGEMHPGVRNLLFRDEHLRQINQALQESERWQQVRSILNAEKPEAIFEAIWKMAQSGPSGDINKLIRVKSLLKPDEWDEVRSAFVHRMGRPVKSAKGFIQKIGWSPTSFTTNYSGMPQPVRDLFLTPTHQRALEELVLIAQTLANTEDLVNKSRTLTNAMGISGLYALGSTAGAVITGDITAGMILGPAFLYGANVLLAYPRYAKWALGYAKLRAGLLSSPGTAWDFTINHRQMVAHIGKLSQLARHNPELVPILRNIAIENGIDQGAEE